MAERLKFKSSEIEGIIKKITELVMGCNNISKFNITAKDIIQDDKEAFKNIMKPVINIPADIYTKMFELVKQSDVEISWHGLVHRDIENQIYTIYDLLVFPQINSPTATTTDEKDFAEWQTKLIMDKDFPIQDLRMHGHSHVNMNVFSSGIDDAYQKDLLTKVEEGDYYLFLILNKKHEICALLYDFVQQILFTTGDLDIIITDNNKEDITTWAKHQIKENCQTQKPKYNPGTYKGHYYNNVYWGSDAFIEDSKVAPKRNFKGGKQYGSK